MSFYRVDFVVIRNPYVLPKENGVPTRRRSRKISQRLIGFQYLAFCHHEVF